MVKVMSDTHPCYNADASQYARMHIPVAPLCNISCNYCNRKYDCLHETRPGVTSEVLTPEEALAKYQLVKERVPNLSVIGIAGPGDALANFAETRKSIELIKAEDPELIFCLSTNGLNLPEYAEQLVVLGVSHVTITINTLDPQIAARIYRYVNYQGKYYYGEEGARILINNQLSGLKYLAEQGLQTKINIVLVKGINDGHIPLVVDKARELGATMTNIMPLIPAEGSTFADWPLVSNKELNALRKQCSGILKQMYHCQQCRADAIGQLTQDRSAEFRGCASTRFSELMDSISEEDINEELYFAIASKNGKLIDQHFGQAEKFLIYKYSSNGVEFIEERKVIKYCVGQECSDIKSRMNNIIKLLSDCAAVLSVRIGSVPKKRLEEAGIKTLNIYERVEDGIKWAVKELDLKLENVI